MKEMWYDKICPLQAGQFPPLPVHWPGSSLNPALLVLYRDFITQAWLIKSLAIGDWLSLQPLSPPLKVSGWTASPHPQVPSRSHLSNTTSDTFITPNTYEIPRIWGACELETMGEDQIMYVKYINSQMLSWVLRIVLANCQNREVSRESMDL